MIKTFRGLLVDGGQVTIRLSTNKGEIGYRIVKFQLMGNQPGAANGEHTMKLYTRKPDAVDAIVDFSDQTLLAASWFATDKDYQRSTEIIIFDNVKFNQDIFLTHSETVGSASCNYYVELEQVKLNENEATVATLKDMRAN